MINDSKVIVCECAGFCNGVKAAVDKAYDAASKAAIVGVPVVTFNALVHNEDVVSELKALGIDVIDDPKDAQGKTVIVPSHGITPAIMDAIKEVAHEVIDATCPHVIRVQKAAYEHSNNGYAVVMLGDCNHKEVVSVVACGKDVKVVSSPCDVDTLEGLDDKPILLISQTTQMQDTFDAVFEKLKKVYSTRVENINTICPATRQRQEEAVKLTGYVDLMIVVGGKNSANTRRLAEVCELSQTKVIQIERADDIDYKLLCDTKTVGITAGASTPRYTIEEVVTTVTDILNNNNESLDAFDITMEEALEMLPKRPKTDESEVVEAIVTAIFDDRILVDIGTGSDATVMAEQLSIRQERPSELVKKGEKINVVIGGYDKKSDSRMASKIKADAFVVWDSLKEAFDNKKTIKGYVAEIVKGGLVVDVGTRAFVPVSQIDVRFVEDLTPYLKKEYEFNIIEVDREKGSVVLSRKALLAEKVKIAKEKAFSTFNSGDVLEGKVTRLADFGAFVDLGDGVEGLLHISEMAYSRINHPSKVFKEGDVIKVKIMNIDKEKDRISLGYKQLLQDPWESVETKYAVDSIVTGTVVRLADFGAFIRLEDGVEGLNHISQISNKRIAKVSDALYVGQEVNVKVTAINLADHRISLSIRQTLEPEVVQEETVVIKTKPAKVAEEVPAVEVIETVEEVVVEIPAIEEDVADVVVDEVVSDEEQA